MTLGVILSPDRISSMTARGDWANKLVLDYVDAVVHEDPDRPAVTDHNSETGVSTTLTYGELDRRARRMALELIDLGVAPGDVVSFQMPNWWQFVALHLACVHAGAISNPLMPIFRERELRFMLGFAQSKVFIAPARFRGFDHQAMMERLRSDLPNLAHAFYVGAEGAQSFEDAFFANGRTGEDDVAGRLAARRPGPNDVTQILYTSGTTGEPKGVMHTANTLFAALGPFANRLGMGKGDVTLMASPLAHQTGFMYGMLLPFMLGIPAVLQDVWSPEAAAQCLQETGATFTMASTPFLTDLTDLPDLNRYDLSKFRVFLSAGAPIPRSLVERATERLGCHVLSGWGMTEIGCITCCAPSDPPEKAFGSDGNVLDGSEVRIVSEDGSIAPIETEGLLQVRPNALFVGYLRRPEAVDVDPDGWFDTGDYARMDADGYVRITGRAKDIIIRGGENIPVVEVEEQLYGHPAIRECAVVAMPDPRLGERACAFIGLHTGATLTFDEMCTHLRAGGMATQYLPEKLIILDALPRTPSGKIQKFLLREDAKGMTPDR